MSVRTFAKRVPALFLSLALLLAFVPVHAQDTQDNGSPFFPPGLVPQEAPIDETAEPAPTYEGLNSCFDYYRFGSTPVVLSADLSSAIAGAPLAFTATVTNQNDYPIVDAGVYIKVFKKRNTTGAKDPNGPDVVDFFPIVDSLTIQPGESLSIKRTWNVPLDAEAGEYHMAAYVATADRFNLLGLSFTDDIIGGAYHFSVVNDREGAVRFDKTSITVGDRTFYFAAYPPRVAAGTESVPISARITNTTAGDKALEVTWELHYWDGLRQDTVIDRTTESVTVPAGGEATATYTVTDTAHSVYYLIGSLESADGTKSIIGVRYVRADVNEPRLNFVGATAYPATGEGSVAFACMHSTGSAPASGGRLELVARKATFLSSLGLGGVLAKETYEGYISGNILALAAPIATDGSFNVTARLYQNDALVDEVTVAYHCEELSPDSCKSDNSLLLIGVGVLIVIVLVGGGLLFMRRRKQVSTPPSPTQLP